MSKQNLMEISKESFTDSIEDKLKENPDLETLRDSNKRMLLHWGSLHGNFELVQHLLKRADVEVDAVDDTLTTPLILAVLGNQTNIADILVQKGANVNQKNMQGHNPLQYACSKTNEDIIKILLSHGADINIRDNIRDTPLHRLAQKGHVAILKILLEHKADVDAQNGEGNTALHIACEDDDGAFAIALLDAGCSIELKNKLKNTALDMCKPGLRRQIKTKLNIVD